MNDKQLLAIHEATHGAQRPTWCALCYINRRADIEGERCDDCGGIIATDLTPNWVYDIARSICEC